VRDERSFGGACRSFPDLVMDADLASAFHPTGRAGDLETPVLLRRAQLTFLDSIMLFAYGSATQADAQGERAVISSTRSSST